MLIPNNANELVNLNYFHNPHPAASNKTTVAHYRRDGTAGVDNLHYGSGILTKGKLAQNKLEVCEKNVSNAV